MSIRMMDAMASLRILLEQTRDTVDVQIKHGLNPKIASSLPQVHDELDMAVRYVERAMSTLKEALDKEGQ